MFDEDPLEPGSERTRPALPNKPYKQVIYQLKVMEWCKRELRILG